MGGDNKVKLKVYGCRGTVSTSRPSSIFGGNTSCIVIESLGHILVLDAGSGLAQFDADLRAKPSNYICKHNEPIDILVSHLHMDHILGLPVFSPCWDNESAGVRIYTCLRNDYSSLKDQVFGPFKPPYWPVPMEDLANAECIPISDETPFTIGPFTVTPFAATHPDETLSFHIDDGQNTLVHLLDNETSAMDDEFYSNLVKYCYEVDMVVFDAAYTPTDYQSKKEWGHSTIEDGYKLAEISGCKQMLFSHFNFEYTDGELIALKKQFEPYGDRFIFSHDGLEIDIT